MSHVILFKSLSNSSIQLISLYLFSHIHSTYLIRSFLKSKAASWSTHTTNIPLQRLSFHQHHPQFKETTKEKVPFLAICKTWSIWYWETLYIYLTLFSNGNKACLHVPPRNWVIIWSFSFRIKKNIGLYCIQIIAHNICF